MQCYYLLQGTISQCILRGVAEVPTVCQYLLCKVELASLFSYPRNNRYAKNTYDSDSVGSALSMSTSIIINIGSSFMHVRLMHCMCKFYAVQWRRVGGRHGPPGKKVGFKLNTVFGIRIITPVRVIASKFKKII